MRNPAFCIFENKDADQLRGYREADQRLCFRYTDTRIPLLSKYEISSLQPSSVLSCTARFVSDLVGNPEDRFSQKEAHMLLTRLLSNMNTVTAKEHPQRVSDMKRLDISLFC